MKKDRVLTENQKAFLSALFGEAEGDITVAKKLAGYSENVKNYEVVNSLVEEIRDLARKYLAMNAPRAAIEQVKVMLDPSQPNSNIKLKAIEGILDRVGVKSDSSGDVNLKVPQGGLFIMPAKERSSEKVTESEDETTEEG